MRRAVVTWVAVVAVLVGAAAAGVLVLNATAFGPAAFVRVYLDAVARGDARGALGMAGVAAPAGARTDFLGDDALPGLTGLREVSVEPGDDSRYVVTFAWRSGERDDSSSFTVERSGSRLGLFPEWSFAVSPIATLELSVEHDARFDLGGIPATTDAASAEPVAFALLVPGVYRVDHHSTYLSADAIDVTVKRPGSVVGATLDVQPDDILIETVTTQVHDLLRECATQQVLFPTGCPFGRAISNRVVSTPAWSIVEFPELTVEPGPEFGTWLIPFVGLTAHLTVDVQSLFDGSISTLDDDVPVTVGYLVTIGADDQTLLITAQEP